MLVFIILAETLVVGKLPKYGTPEFEKGLAFTFLFVAIITVVSSLSTSKKQKKATGRD
jgi:hypothetical protein